MINFDRWEEFREFFVNGERYRIDLGKKHPLSRIITIHEIIDVNHIVYKYYDFSNHYWRYRIECATRFYQWYVNGKLFKASKK